MKITKLHIENFGKLQNYDIDFSEGRYQNIFSPGFFFLLISSLCRKTLRFDFHCFFSLDVKPDRAFGFWGRWRRALEELLDRLKDDLELTVIFFLHLLDLFSQIRMFKHELSQLGEGSHDLDIYFHSSFAIENAR